jgi:hypothetical protein
MASKFTNGVKEHYNNSNIQFNFSKSFWKEIYKYYELINKQYTTNLNIIINENINQNLDIIDKIKSNLFTKNTFVSSNIRKTLHKYIYVHEFVCNQIRILYFSNNIKLTVKSINDVYLCIYRVHAITKLFNNNKPIIISIFPTLFKKTINKLSKKIKPLGTKNVNSGLTFYSLSDNDNGTIIIWRYEELKKVLIHELFHAIYIDLGLILNENLFKKYMKINFKLNKFIGVNESYVETIASIFNILLYIIETTKSKSYIKDYIHIELFYCITKASQILNYYNFNSLDELIKSKQKVFNQNSNVFSYYILKTMILYKFDKIICILNKSKCIYNYLMLNTNKKCSNNYLHVISSIYTKQFDMMIKNIIKKHKFINSSLRMTCIE